MSGGDDNFWIFKQPIAYCRFVTKALNWKNRGILCVGGYRMQGNVHAINNRYLDAAFPMEQDLKIR